MWPEDLISIAWITQITTMFPSFKGAPFACSFLESFAWSYNFLGGNYSISEGV
jgi:hypothetical protein